MFKQSTTAGRLRTLVLGLLLLMISSPLYLGLTRSQTVLHTECSTPVLITPPNDSMGLLQQVCTSELDWSELVFAAFDVPGMLAIVITSILFVIVSIASIESYLNHGNLRQLGALGAILVEATGYEEPSEQLCTNQVCTNGPGTHTHPVAWASPSRPDTPPLSADD